MFNFSKKEPPPPPPSSKVPEWVQLAVPIIFAIILGLITYSFNGYKSHAEMRMDENKEEIDKLKEQKVDNQTMQLMIKLQEQQIKSSDEKIKRVEKSLDEIKELIKEQSKVSK